MNKQLKLVEKNPKKTYYYGNKIDLVNDFYLTYDGEKKKEIALTVDKLPIDILCLVTTNDKHNISSEPIITVPNDQYNIYLDKLGNYNMTITFEKVTINNTTYIVSGFVKNFNVIKKIIKLTFNNFSIKKIMNVGELIPIYTTFDDFFDIVCPETKIINAGTMKNNNLFNYATFSIINEHNQIIAVGSPNMKYYKIDDKNTKLTINIDSYDCYCYDFSIDKFKITIDQKFAYISVKKDFSIKVGEPLIINNDDIAIYDTNNNILREQKINILVNDAPINLVPFLEAGVYYIKFTANNIVSENALLAITKYETEIVTNIFSSYKHNDSVKLKELVYVTDKLGNKFDITYFVVNGKQILNELVFNDCGKYEISCVFIGYRTHDACEKNIIIYIEPVKLNPKFILDNYIILGYEKYNFSFENEIVFNQNNVDHNDFKYSLKFKRNVNESSINTNFTIDFKNPDVNKSITDVLTNYTVVSEKIMYLSYKYFNSTDFTNLITKINIVLGIDLYMICYYRENDEVKNVIVNSEVWFEQLEQRYQGISGLSYDYFLVASVVKNSVVGFSIDNIFIPFSTILYIEIGKMTEYSDITYIPQYHYVVTSNITLKNNDKCIYNISDAKTNLYLINYLNQVQFIINNGDPIDAIFGTTVNLYNYNIQAFIQYPLEKIDIDPSIFTIENDIDYNTLNEGSNDANVTIVYSPRNYYWTIPIKIVLLFPTIYVNVNTWKNEKIIAENLKNYGTYFSATFGPVTSIIEELKTTNQLPKYPYINSNLPLENFNNIIIVPIIPIPSYSYADKVVQLSKYQILLGEQPYDNTCHMAEFITSIYIKPFIVSVSFNDIIIDSNSDVFINNSVITARTKTNKQDFIIINTASIINKFIYNPNGKNLKADITFAISNTTTDYSFSITDTAKNIIFVKNLGNGVYRSNTFIYNIMSEYPTIQFPQINDTFYIYEIYIRQFSRFQ